MWIDWQRYPCLIYLQGGNTHAITIIVTNMAFHVLGTTPHRFLLNWFLTSLFRELIFSMRMSSWLGFCIVFLYARLPVSTTLTWNPTRDKGITRPLLPRREHPPPPCQTLDLVSTASSQRPHPSTLSVASAAWPCSFGVPTLPPIVVLTVTCPTTHSLTLFVAVTTSDNRWSTHHTVHTPCDSPSRCVLPPREVAH
jgi:hypothetical protein